MRLTREGNLLLVVMERGELFSDCARALRSSPEMGASGTIVTALGLLKNTVIGYGTYVDGVVGYLKETLVEPHELLGMSGFILGSDTWPFHIHATLGNAERNVKGGHFFDAEIVTFIEMAIQVTDTRLDRVVRDGLPEMRFFRD